MFVEDTHCQFRIVIAVSYVWIKFLSTSWFLSSRGNSLFIWASRFPDSSPLNNGRWDWACGFFIIPKFFLGSGFPVKIWGPHALLSSRQYCWRIHLQIIHLFRRNKCKTSEIKNRNLILPNKHALKDAFPLNITPLFKQATPVFQRLPCKKDECHHGVIKMMSVFFGKYVLEIFRFYFLKLFQIACG